jgi:putative NADPH-quinone reductase
MLISVILAHPDPASFNHAIAQTAVEALKANGHTVFFHDLYQEKFDPLLNSEEISKDAMLPSTIKQHCEEIASADGIIIVHANWWGQPPAILKGWVDRVIRPGVAYEFLEMIQEKGFQGACSKSRGSACFQHIQHSIPKRKECFWRSTGDDLEKLYLRSLRRH